MGQLLCHLVGDYVLQNHWMANRKTSSSFACAVHVALYTLAFLALTRSPAALAVIAGTHFLIDRFRLARYWVEFWGVGCEGRVTASLRAVLPVAPVKPAPDFLAVWLLILVDNTAHLLINAAALNWLA